MMQLPNLRSARTIRAMLFMAVLAMLLEGCYFHIGQQIDTSCHEPIWPQDRSDLSPDPDLVFGRLGNGVRYVVAHNPEPRNRVALYLDVRAGSLHESDNQRGVAHFVEHMAFNGTTAFPPGTLVEYFQSIGMGFGADTNAYTGFDATVYKLMLPSGDPQTLADGLGVLADYATGVLFLPEEIDKERGIMLAEKRSRDSAAARVRREQRAFQFAGTLIPARDPIGNDQTLEQADSNLLRQYYQTWYRPDNMIVIVVGDTEPESAIRSIQATFDPLTGSDPDQECPDFGEVPEKGLAVHYLYEPELGYTEVSLGTVWNEIQGADTIALEREMLERYLATAMLGNRLIQMSHGDVPPFTAAHSQSGVFLGRYGYASLLARVDGGGWPEALAALQHALDQAMTDGFTKEELTRVRKEFLAYLDAQVQTAANRNSGERAREFLDKLNRHEVILSPEQEKSLYAGLLKEMDLDRINRGLQRIWHHDRRQVGVAGTADLMTVVNPEAVIASRYQAALAAPLAVWRPGGQHSFPYLPSPGGEAAILEQAEHPAVGSRSWLLSGGLMVHAKQTAFQANEVLMSVHFGMGRVEEPEPGLGLLAELVVNGSGTGRLRQEQFQEALAGSTIDLRFSAGRESFAYSGKALAKDFGLLLRVLYHRLHDPGFREEAYRRAMEQLQQTYEQMSASVEGRLRTGGDRFLGGGSALFGLPDREQITGLTLDQVRSWLSPVFHGSALEINVVGDIDPEEVLALVRETFGIERRHALPAPERHSPSFPAGQSLELTVPTSVDKAVLVIAWPTEDYWDISRSRRLGLLASVLEDRLRAAVREEMGAVYSPKVRSLPSREYPGFGMLRTQVVIAPGQRGPVSERIRDAARQLAAEGLDGKELRRALAPLLTSIRDARRTNGYWLNAVLSLSSRHPEQLDWAQTLIGDYSAITPEEIKALAGQYLQTAKAAEVFVFPADRIPVPDSSRGAGHGASAIPSTVPNQ